MRLVADKPELLQLTLTQAPDDPVDHSVWAEIVRPTLGHLKLAAGPVEDKVIKPGRTG